MLILEDGEFRFRYTLDRRKADVTITAEWSDDFVHFYSAGHPNGAEGLRDRTRSFDGSLEERELSVPMADRTTGSVRLQATYFPVSNGAKLLKIMPMGDSLTAGHNIPGGYRKYLYDQLTLRSVAFDFVGALEYQPGDPTPDRDFFGAGGLQISTAQDLVEGRSCVIMGATKYDLGLWSRLPEAIHDRNFSTAPNARNIILLMIGLNDHLKQVAGTHYGAVAGSAATGGAAVGQDKIAESAFERLLAFLQRINGLAAASGLRIEVFVGTQTEFSGGTGGLVQQQEMREYNRRILTELAQGSAPLFSHIVVWGVDAFSSFSTQLLDGIHPNEAGYNSLGTFWADVIAPTTGEPPQENLPPTVAITGLASGTTLPEGTPLTLTATASDPDGSILRVEFMSGGTVIGTATTAPYQFPWTVPPAGNYVLTARAVDNASASTVSAPITLVSSDGAPPPPPNLPPHRAVQ
jgi:lysophospholipase L1-like esterase